MSRVSSWFLLRKITKHISLLYLFIFKKMYSKKVERHLCILFFDSFRITDRSLLKSNKDKRQYRHFTRNLTKVLTAALKDKKSCHVDMTKNLRFKQSQMNCIKKAKRHIRLLTNSIGVGVLPKLMRRFMS